MFFQCFVRVRARAVAGKVKVVKDVKVVKVASEQPQDGLPY